MVSQAIRRQVWLFYVGPKQETRCTISWCKNKISVFDFHVGHDQPESKEGPTTIENLRPICAACNLSMSNTQTIQQWNKMQRRKKWWSCAIFPVQENSNPITTTNK